MATYRVKVVVKGPTATFLSHPLTSDSERIQLEGKVRFFVNGDAKLENFGSPSMGLLPLTSEIPMTFIVTTDLWKSSTINALKQGIKAFYGNDRLEIFVDSIEEMGPLEGIVGKTDLRGAVAAFAGSFMIGAVLGIIVKLFRG
jgi:hypothetical protein